MLIVAWCECPIYYHYYLYIHIFVEEVILSCGVVVSIIEIWYCRVTIEIDGLDVEIDCCCCDAVGFCIIVVGIRVDLMASHGTNFESTSIGGLRD